MLEIEKLTGVENQSNLHVKVANVKANVKVANVKVARVVNALVKKHIKE